MILNRLRRSERRSKGFGGGLLSPKIKKWSLRRLPRSLRIALGVLMLGGGLAGLILPFLQGVLMIIAGLAILRKDIPLVSRLWDRWIGLLWERWRHRS